MGSAAAVAPAAGGAVSELLHEVLVGIGAGIAGAVLFYLLNRGTP